MNSIAASTHFSTTIRSFLLYINDNQISLLPIVDSPNHLHNNGLIAIDNRIRFQHISHSSVTPTILMPDNGLIVNPSNAKATLIQSTRMQRFLIII